MNESSIFLIDYHHKRNEDFWCFWSNCNNKLNYFHVTNNFQTTEEVHT